MMRMRMRTRRMGRQRAEMKMEKGTKEEAMATAMVTAE